MAGAISIEVRGVREIVSRFEGAANRLPELAEEIGELTRAAIVEHFSTKSGPDGAWAPWAPGYAGNSLMVRTGALVGSIQAETEGLIARVSTDVEYAIYHESGTSKMPARRFMGITGEQEARMVRQIEAFLLEMFS